MLDKFRKYVLQSYHMLMGTIQSKYQIISGHGFLVKLIVLIRAMLNGSKPSVCIADEVSNLVCGLA